MKHESRRLRSWLIFDVGQSMIRAEIHDSFVRRFSFPRLTPVGPVSRDALIAVEHELKVTFPSSYLSFLVAHGPIFSPDILHLLVSARESGDQSAKEGFDVREFFTPVEIVESYRMYVSGGMDEWLVPFAMDSCGSAFGFRREQRTPRPDDSPVFFFDHDYCKIRPEADSFDVWLQSYLSLPS